MSETISNDYVSMINKKGSGYNIPVIVDAIVDAAIAPMKNIVTAKKDQADATISGMATLKSSALASQTLINNMSSTSHHTLKQSPDSNYMRSSVSDESALVAGVNKIQNVVVANPQVWRADGETNLSRTITDQTITIEFGVNGEDDSGWTASDPARSAQVVWSDDTLSSAVSKLNNIVGLKAEIVQLDSNSNSYSIVLTSEPGAKNGFKMSNSGGTGWKTAVSGTGDAFQQSTDSTFTLNGTNYTRSSNVVTDAVTGMTIELLSDRSELQTITVAKSATNIQKTVETLIADLNAYKSDLNALGFIDEAGDKDGQLANNSYLRSAKQKLMNLMTAPITGYGDNNIYFVELGIKTATDGSYVFDKTIFDRTFSQEPEKFDALTQDKAYASDPNVFVYSTSNSAFPQGKHTFTGSPDKLDDGTSSEKALTRTGSGPYTFSTSDYSGFLFQTSSANPGNFDIYVGRSAKTKLFNFFADALATSGSHDKVVDLYKDRSTSLDAKLTKIDQREALLQAMYTKQFSEMEKVVNTSTSSADYVTQLVDGWNK